MRFDRVGNSVVNLQNAQLLFTEWKFTIHTQQASTFDESLFIFFSLWISPSSCFAEFLFRWINLSLSLTESLSLFFSLRLFPLRFYSFFISLTKSHFLITCLLIFLELAKDIDWNEEQRRYKKCSSNVAKVITKWTKCVLQVKRFFISILIPLTLNI